MQRRLTCRLVVLLGLVLPAQGAGPDRPGRPKLPPDWGRRTRPVGLWLGQDEHDLAGPAPLLGPSGVQDIHIALAGLPRGIEVKSGSIRGLGGSEWVILEPWGPWKAALERKAGATTADLYVEPDRAEAGRPFTVHLDFADGRSAEFVVSGGKADPQLRMPAAALAVHWIGQDGEDRVGVGPGVGPDGLQDVHLALERLAPGVEVRKVAVQVDGGATYESGVNPEGRNAAELIRRADDPTRADLFFQPDRNLDRRRLLVRVSYANEKTDSQTITAGAVDPARAMPSIRPPVLETLQLRADWRGQDGTARGKPGAVHVTVAGLPAGRKVRAAALSDVVGGTWAFRADDAAPLVVEPFAAPLGFRATADGTRADLHFDPIRDESGSALTLRLLFHDGRSAVAGLAGGPCDPGRVAVGPGSGTIDARPGADLHALVRRGGTVILKPGSYRLDRPLVLDRPVTLRGEPGAVLHFRQPADAPTWTAAIKLHFSHTTLEGFAVRLDGPIRWTPGTNYGPAVIGATDNHDRVPHDLKVDLVLRRLDLESPPAATEWDEAPRLIRLAGARSGRVEANTLRGGMTEFVGGPWSIVDNHYNGTVPHTYCYGVFAGHGTHDLIVRGNRAEPSGATGKTWRFLVLTGSGVNDRIEDNRVVGIGPRDDDSVQGVNAPEIVLTESYRLHFEGRPAGLSADGRVVAIRGRQGDPARSGSVLAVLTGPHAGTWHRIAQAIDAETYLLETPLPSDGGLPIVSIATGFVDEVFRNNTIDARGSSTAVDLFLAGNHFGTRVEGNHLLGAGALRIVAAPTEAPVHWGWSHAPMLGLTIAGNVTEDANGGAGVGVEHSPAIRSSRGRTYFRGTMRDHVVRWTAGFPGRKADGSPAPGLALGEPGATDPAELIVTAEGNRAEAAGRERPRLQIRGATVNGKAIRDAADDLPTAANR